MAAHVTAASAGGPRFDPSLSADERTSIENGIWLCQNCAKLVDNDPLRFTAVELRAWKAGAESEALARVGQTNSALARSRTESQPPIERLGRTDLTEILGALPSAHLAMLQKASTGVAELALFNDAVAALVKMQLLEHVADLDRARGLYRLHPAAAEQVVAFFRTRRETQVREVLDAISPEAKEFLQLYTTPAPPAHAPQHPFVRAELYNSLYPLDRSGLLVRGTCKGKAPYCERIAVADDAVSAIEELLANPLARTAIEFDLERVGSAADSGSGIQSGWT